MKCGFKYCRHVESEKLIQVGNKKYHQKCNEDIEHLKKTGELYQKYYNNKESWAIMMRSMHNWYKSGHEAEYILFCLCKAIRKNKRLNNFFSLYYLLNDLTYMELYEKETAPKENMMIFENVYLSETDHHELLQYMNQNNTKLEYYIRKLNEYMIQTGRDYKSHKETIIRWYDKEELRKPVSTKNNII